MKARCYTILTALSLAVLCLSSARVATANSVIGNGTVRLASGPPFIFAVSARSETSGTMRLQQGPNSWLGNVVDVAVVENVAVLAAQITQSSDPDALGDYLYVAVRDNGQKGDEVLPIDLLSERFPHEELFGFAADIYDFAYPLPPILGGNLTVTGYSCFTAGTRVTMADGSEKPIEQIEVGERVLGPDGEVNRVLHIERPLLGARKLYALNGGVPFVTAEHPFMTKDGWKAIDPAATAAENPSLIVATLKTGDALVRVQGMEASAAPKNGSQDKAPAVRLASIALERVEARSADPKTPLYNLRLDGSHVYFANGYLVHNK